ncbi:MAG: hypothetical protein NZ580_01445 [Bacteroidia bacterium]|nr:hypothetical protein [Bacteroidia bacterium]MDW8235354.1 hypothetical protein [Bacteroidia bacterium]
MCRDSKLFLLTTVCLLQGQSPEENASPPKQWRLQLYQELGYNYWIGLPAALRTTVTGAGSIKFNLKLLPYINIGKFYIGIGGGMVIREVRFEKPVLLFDENNKLSYDTPMLPPKTQAKSKLQLGYFHVPIEIGLHWRKLHLAAFGFGELLSWSKYKFKYRQGQELTRYLVFGNSIFHTELVQYGVGGRIGWRGIGIFGSYNPSALWHKNEGPPGVHPLQIGIYIYNSPKVPKKKIRNSSVTYL